MLSKRLEITDFKDMDFLSKKNFIRKHRGLYAEVQTKDSLFKGELLYEDFCKDEYGYFLVSILEKDERLVVVKYLDVERLIIDKSVNLKEKRVNFELERFNDFVDERASLSTSWDF